MADVYDLTGAKSSTIKLPRVFDTDIRADLIKRAVVSMQSHRLQPFGPDWLAGKDTSAFSYGPGRGLARLPRIRGGGPQSGRGAIVPYAVGGRRAHPPVPERNLSKKINKKESNLATASAIACTAIKELVEARGHIIDTAVNLPIVMTDDLEKIDKTKEVKAALFSLGLESELSRSAVKAIRAGKGTRRGRKYKRKRGVLMVTSKHSPLLKAANNIPGVDVTTAHELNVEHLAPGANPARLTIYTVGALKELDNRFGSK